MHILHISADFSNTKVHTNLFKQLDIMGVEQTIFNPIKVTLRKTIGRNEFEAEHTRFVYADVVKPFHRYAYHIKRQVVFNALQNKIELKNVDMVNATALFTDGGQAYKIYKKYHIPYVVAVRTTDISGFLERLPNTWMTGRKILINAEKIFFISKALMDKFINHKVIKPILSEIKDKTMLIPNGIDDYFINNMCHEPHVGHKVLYVGDFSPNKNVLRLIEAVLQMRNEGGFHDVTLTIVGGGKAEGNDVQTMVDSHPDCIQFLGPIYDKGKLCEVFRSHSVFAMPSISETFGLVYLEALSQNLPVVYTKGQGIDGLFPSTIGEGVNPLSIEEIKKALISILKRNTMYSNEGINFEMFRWNEIASVYFDIYNHIINKK